MDIRKRLTDEKGVSPVISTIIIVAIVIAISIAVTMYLIGISDSFSRFGQLEVTSAYADVYNNTHYLAGMVMKNAGTAPLTIDSVLINGKPQNFAASWTANNPSSGTTPSGTVTLNESATSGRVITIATGDTGTLVLYLSKSAYKSGQSLEITFHTMDGYEYPKAVVLPILP